MLDLSTPVSPVVAIVETLDDSTKHILIDSNKTDVVYVEPYHIRNNTRAYINEYDTDAKLNIIRNHREIHYDRIDLNELMGDIATLTPDANDQLCHVIHTPVYNSTIHNIDSSRLSDLLNQYYDIPVEVTDFSDVTQERVKPIVSSMGTVYRIMNCVTTDIDLSYTGGTITRYDESQKTTVSNPGFVVNREWKNGDVLTLLPNENINKTGWVIEIGFNDNVEYTTPVSPKLILTQNDRNQSWDVTINDKVVTTFNGNPESGVTLEVGNKTLVVDITGSESNPVSIEVPELYKDRGVMRIVAYTTNPYPSLYRLGFDLTTPEVAQTDGLVINNKNYAPVYNLILSDTRSNAVVGDIMYPVSVSPYRINNYVEREADIFNPVDGDQWGSIEVFVKPVGFNSQKVTFMLDYEDGTLPVDTVAHVIITITDTRNVNNKFYVKSIIINDTTAIVGAGPSLNALAYKKVEGAAASEIFSVTIAAGNVDVTEDDVVLGKYTSLDEVDSTDVSIYKVDIEVQVKPNKTLPNIGVTHTPSIASNE